MSDSEGVSGRIRDFDDDDDVDLSETISGSGATQSGSMETVDRLSVLSDSVPELLDADSLSEMSIGVAKDTAGSAGVSASAAEPGRDGWRVIPIKIIPCTEIVIERCDESRCQCQ